MLLLARALSHSSYCIALLSEGSPCCGAALTLSDLLPGQRPEDAAVKLSARNAPALEFGVRQPGQLLVEGSCRVSISTRVNELDDACTEPLGLVACQSKRPTNRGPGDL